MNWQVKGREDVDDESNGLLRFVQDFHFQLALVEPHHATLPTFVVPDVIVPGTSFCMPLVLMNPSK
jgi:hypothetical protein